MRARVCACACLMDDMSLYVCIGLCICRSVRLCLYLHLPPDIATYEKGDIALSVVIFACIRCKSLCLCAIGVLC